MLTRFNGVEMIAHYHGDQQCLQENIRLTSDLPGFKRSQCRSFYKSSSNFDGGNFRISQRYPSDCLDIEGRI